MYHSHLFTSVKIYGQFFPIAGKFSYFRKRACQNLVATVTLNSVNIQRGKTQQHARTLRERLAQKFSKMAAI